MRPMRPMRSRWGMKTAMLILSGFTIPAPMSAYAGLLGPDNFPECVLSLMPGAANNTVAYEISGACSRQFPGNAPAKKKTGFFASYNSGSECTLKKAKDTPSPWAANMIRMMCYSLYEPELPQLDESKFK